MIFLILFVLFAGLFGWFAFEGTKAKKQMEQRIAAFRAAHDGWETFIADVMFNPTLLAIDPASRQMSVGTLEDHVDVAWSDICQVEVESNGTSLTTTNRGAQLLGGVVGNALLGPMGLLIGGVTGSKSTRQRVNTLALKIVVEHPSRPTHRVVFFRKGGKGLTPNARLLAGPAGRLEHFHALLLNAMRAVERERDHRLPAPATEQPDVEQRIGRLWELRQAGALTQ